MRYTSLVGFGLAAALAGSAGCEKKEDPPKVGVSKGNKSPGHVHGKGPHGGVIFDLGKYHGEFVVDHDKKECTLYVLGADEQTPVPVSAAELTLATKETKTMEGKAVPPLAVKLTPADAKDGKATRFVGTDPGLGNVADFAGTVSGVIDGKPSTGEFVEQ